MLRILIWNLIFREVIAQVKFFAGNRNWLLVKLLHCSFRNSPIHLSEEIEFSSRRNEFSMTSPQGYTRDFLVVNSQNFDQKKRKVNFFTTRMKDDTEVPLELFYILYGKSTLAVFSLVWSDRLVIKQYCWISF